jgi:hypothetical protein
MIISAEWWDLFDAEYILEFQPDTFMFYNNVHHFYRWEFHVGGGRHGAPTMKSLHT